MALEIWSSLLTFAGGVFLTVDGLVAASKIHAESGGERFLAAVLRRKIQVVGDDGQPLTNPTDLRAWLARKVQRRSWLGFALITLGFLIDLVSKVAAIFSPAGSS